MATIMAPWRDRRKWSHDEFIPSLAGLWARKLVNNEPLNPSEVMQFLAAVGFQVEPDDTNFGAERLDSMLREWDRYGLYPRHLDPGMLGGPLLGPSDCPFGRPKPASRGYCDDNFFCSRVSCPS